MLIKPRFEVGTLPTAEHRNRLTCGVFDSFVQQFVTGPNSRAQVERDARAANRAYEDGQCIFAGAAE